MAKQVRVALTGPGGSGKTYIVQKVTSQLRARGLSVANIESPTRYIRSLGYQINQGTSWDTQLLSGALRVIRQKEAVLSEADVVLADRALSCELGYDEVAMKELHGPGYSFQSAHRILQDFWREDIREYWDLIAFKGLNPDFPPESDGDRITDLKFHKETEGSIRYHAESASPEKFRLLAPHRDDAAQEVFDVVVDLYKKGTIQ